MKTSIIFLGCLPRLWASLQLSTAKNGSIDRNIVYQKHKNSINVKRWHVYFCPAFMHSSKSNRFTHRISIWCFFMGRKSISAAKPEMNLMHLSKTFATTFNLHRIQQSKDWRYKENLQSFVLLKCLVWLRCYMNSIGYQI